MTDHESRLRAALEARLMSAADEMRLAWDRLGDIERYIVGGWEDGPKEKRVLSERHDQYTQKREALQLAIRSLLDELDALRARNTQDHLAGAHEGRSCGGGWVSISERLPAKRQSVALVHVERWENVGELDWNRNVHAAGYLDSLGGVTFWSVRGERALCLDAFTHWLPLPDATVTQGHSHGSEQDGAGDCWCEHCDLRAHAYRTRMSVCPKCGDKRCQRAKHHGNACEQDGETSAAARAQEQPE